MDHGQQSDYVSLSQLAEMFGIDRSHVRRYAVRHGFRFGKARDIRTGQLVNVLNKNDAERLLAIRRREGFPVYEGTTCTTPPPSQRTVPGWMCIIQLAPDLDPRRVWIGFAADPETKLAVCRPLAPTAQIVKAWPCRPAWEPAAMDVLTNGDCSPLSDNVFVCKDLQALVERGEEFFRLLPAIHGPIPFIDG